MNSLEHDLIRAVGSVRFLIAVIIQVLILLQSGADSTLYQMSVPLCCTLPYTCTWLDESRSGFVRLALHRTSVFWYITGKFLACIVSGGLCELTGAYIASLLDKELDLTGCYPQIFLAAALWAGIAALLAACSGSKYSAYGGAFVICYFLIILHERYWKSCYVLNPLEWLNPKEQWVFGMTGLHILLIGIITVTGLCYAAVLERRLTNA